MHPAAVRILESIFHEGNGNMKHWDSILEQLSDARWIKCAAFTLQSLLGGQMCQYRNQAVFSNPQVGYELTSFNVIFSFMPPPFLLLRWPISPGCVLSFSPPPSSPVRRRYHATSTAWRSSKAVHSSCPTMMT